MMPGARHTTGGARRRLLVSRPARAPSRRRPTPGRPSQDAQSPVPRRRVTGRTQGGTTHPGENRPQTSQPPHAVERRRHVAHGMMYAPPSSKLGPAKVGQTQGGWEAGEASGATSRVDGRVGKPAGGALASAGVWTCRRTGAHGGAVECGAVVARRPGLAVQLPALCAERASAPGARRRPRSHT